MAWEEVEILEWKQGVEEITHLTVVRKQRRRKGLRSQDHFQPPIPAIPNFLPLGPS